MGSRKPRRPQRHVDGRAQFSSPACFLHETESEAGVTGTASSTSSKPRALRRRSGRRQAIRLKRVYAKAEPQDGVRLLVDRLWPRGISKHRAALDGWLRHLAPSSPLRRWFGHDPRRWPEFRRRYRAELAAHQSELDEIRERARHNTITLLYGARDAKINHAVVLREVLLGRIDGLIGSA